MELGRYFNAKEEPIVLSRSKKHMRLALTRRKRSGNDNKSPFLNDKSLLQIEEGVESNDCNGKD